MTPAGRPPLKKCERVCCVCGEPITSPYAYAWDASTALIYCAAHRTEKARAYRRRPEVMQRARERNVQRRQKAREQALRQGTAKRVRPTGDGVPMMAVCVGCHRRFPAATLVRGGCGGYWCPTGTPHVLAAMITVQPRQSPRRQDAAGRFMPASADTSTT